VFSGLPLCQRGEGKRSNGGIDLIEEEQSLADGRTPRGVLDLLEIAKRHQQDQSTTSRKTRRLDRQVAERLQCCRLQFLDVSAIADDVANGVEISPSSY